MTNRSDEWEPYLRHLVARFDYPATPDIAGAVRRRTHPRPRYRSRRWVLALVCLLLVVAAGFAPPIRAAVERWWRIGAVEIVVVTPEPELVPQAPTALPEAATSLPQGTSEPLPSEVVRPTDVPPLVGVTTLEDARKRLRFPVMLPTYPAGLGEPDEVYVQQTGSILVLVWNVKPRLSLQVFDSEIVARKLLGSGTDAQRTTVDGREAAWIDVPHVLEYTLPNGSRDYREGRFVEGNVLVWATDALTYRLESGLSLEEARRVAESLR